MVLLYFNYYYCVLSGGLVFGPISGANSLKLCQRIAQIDTPPALHNYCSEYGHNKFAPLLLVKNSMNFCEELLRHTTFFFPAILTINSLNFLKFD